jgi:class 3 adenylate cyclase/tetratricopeptide (TPR) repeat protein
MKCPRCSHENSASQKFCGECGAHVAGSCPACGAGNPPEQKFCGECGARLGEGAAKFVSPQSYTPKHLVDRILLAKGVLEGERKQVTVLFADLKGSMELISERDPKEARKLLDPVLERMIEAVHRFDGMVNQVMGDGIMALFGAPLALEDHAVRACYAALAMQESVKQYSERTRTTEGVEVQIRAGLNSGEVVVRAIGSDLHMDYSAIGQTTHLAARMEQLALAGTIRITAEALRLAEGFVQVKPLGAVPVKGLAGPVEVFELTGAAAVRTRMQATAARGLTRFVGRQVEIDALARALKQTEGSSGQLVAAVGEPGVGKSRLYWEFTRSHRTHMPEDRETTELAIDLRFRLRTVLAPLGEFERIFARLREAESLAHGIEDKDRLGWVSCYLTHYYGVSGNPESGLQHGNRAISIAEALGDFPLLVAARLFAAAAHGGLGEYAEARRVAAKNIDAIPRERERDHFRIAGPVAAWSRNTLILCLAEQGDFAEGLAQGDETLRISLEANYSYTLAGAYFSLGYLQLRRGELRSALDWLEQGVELCRTRDLPWQLPQMSAALGYAYAISGRLEDAEALLPRATGGTSGFVAPSTVGWLGYLHLLVLGPEDAFGVATREFELSRQQKAKGREAWALHLIGEIEACRPGHDLSAAEAAFRDSLTLAVEHGMRPLQAHCHLGLGKLFARARDKMKAQDHLGTATAMMREMEMGIWLQQAQAALAEATS